MTERVLLAVVDFKRRGDWLADDVAAECRELIVACGGEVVETVFCRAKIPTPDFLIGHGKAEEIIEICKAQNIDTAIFSHDLKGSQQRNLEEALSVKVIDRTQLILDIFARRAKSQEGRMQVELAQLQYLLPRLAGKGVELSRLGGGIGTLGPGETKLEVDRRRIKQRVTNLKRELQKVSSARKLTRKKRKENQVPLISLVGYTNAGKSTLLNTLTQAKRTVKDGLFTTLDPLSRQYVLPNNQKVVFSDTVGFLHALPHGLVEAFHATLEEVVEAELLLHIVDVSNPKFRDFIESVSNVLEEIHAQEKTIITVFNKIDKTEDKKEFVGLIDGFENCVCISAETGENIDLLIAKIMELLVPSTVEVDVKIPITRMDLVNLIHKEGEIHSIEYSEKSVHVSATVPSRLASKLK
ncbi:MAG: GTPase HflX [Candidatus Aceula meridiana]|nr:GTPase HflX [Candidatus Aceula meridiana]